MPKYIHTVHTYIIDMNWNLIVKAIYVCMYVCMYVWRRSMKHMIFLAGLRGAVAYALANLFPDVNGNRSGAHYMYVCMYVCMCIHIHTYIYLLFTPT